MDTLYFDEAVSGHKNSNYSVSASVTVSTDSTGTVLNVTTNGHSYRLQQDADNRFTATAPFIVELDILEVTNMAMRLYQSSTIASDISFTNTGHYKFIVKNNKVTYSIDDGTPTEISFNYTDALQIWLRSTVTGTASLKFKNLLIYSD